MVLDDKVQQSLVKYLTELKGNLDNHYDNESIRKFVSGKLDGFLDALYIIGGHQFMELIYELSEPKPTTHV